MPVRGFVVQQEQWVRYENISKVGRDLVRPSTSSHVISKVGLLFKMHGLPAGPTLWSTAHILSLAPGTLMILHNIHSFHIVDTSIHITY